MHTEMLAVTRYLGFTKPENSKGQNRKSIPKSRGVFWQSQSTSKPTSLQNMWRFIASSPAALSMQQSEGLLRITKGMINASLREKCGVPSIGGGELPQTVGFSCLPLVPCFSTFCSCPFSLGSCSEVVALVGRWHWEELCNLHQSPTLTSSWFVLVQHCRLCKPGQVPWLFPAVSWRKIFAVVIGWYNCFVINSSR